MFILVCIILVIATPFSLSFVAVNTPCRRSLSLSRSLSECRSSMSHSLSLSRQPSFIYRDKDAVTNTDIDSDTARDIDRDTDTDTNRETETVSLLHEVCALCEQRLSQCSLSQVQVVAERLRSAISLSPPLPLSPSQSSSSVTLSFPRRQRLVAHILKTVIERLHARKESGRKETADANAINVAAYREATESDNLDVDLFRSEDMVRIAMSTAHIVSPGHKDQQDIIDSDIRGLLSTLISFAVEKSVNLQSFQSALHFHAKFKLLPLSSAAVETGVSLISSQSMSASNKLAVTVWDVVLGLCEAALPCRVDPFAILWNEVDNKLALDEGHSSASLLIPPVVVNRVLRMLRQQLSMIDDSTNRMALLQRWSLFTSVTPLFNKTGFIDDSFIATIAPLIPINDVHGITKKLPQVSNLYPNISVLILSQYFANQINEASLSTRAIPPDNASNWFHILFSRALLNVVQNIATINYFQIDSKEFQYLLKHLVWSIGHDLNDLETSLEWIAYYWQKPVSSAETVDPTTCEYSKGLAVIGLDYLLTHNVSVKFAERVLKLMSLVGMTSKTIGGLSFVNQHHRVVSLPSSETIVPFLKSFSGLDISEFVGQ